VWYALRKMDWIILGCGYVGTRLAQGLLREGHRVRVCARNTARLEPLGQAGAEVHAMDGAEPRAFDLALHGLRAPVVVYSIPPMMSLPPAELVRRAADAAMNAGAQRFIYLGSTSVYGETEHGVTVDEDSPIAAGDAEAAPRVAEESAVEAGVSAGLPGVVLRLAAIYGPGRGVRERLKIGAYKLIDDGMGWFSRVHVDDLVGIIRAAAERAPVGARYCVADDHPSTQREYAEWLSTRMGLPLPPAAPPQKVDAPRRAARHRKVSNARLKRELDYVFRYPSFVEGERAIEREAFVAP
jgi:nucleoside-diphosphate-sugar epimerase